MDKPFCCVCGSRRQRNLISDGYELLGNVFRYHICIRCYLWYYVISEEGGLSRAIIERTYAEIKKSDWTPNIRYGNYFTPQIEKQIVNYFRQKYTNNNASLKESQTLWEFLNREWKRLSGWCSR